MLRLMTFNIRYGNADDGAQHWQYRRALALDRIRTFAPDLLGLQECRDDAQAADVRDALPDYRFHGVRRGGGGDPGLEMAPLLFRESRFAPLRGGHFWLSDTPQQPGSRSWGSAFTRTASWVELRDRETLRTLFFLNTHFDYEASAIDGAAQLLRNWLDREVGDAPLVVSGDFNCEAGSDAHRLLLGHGLVDAWRVRHPQAQPQDAISYHGYGAADDAGALDWLLVSPHFAVLDAAIDRHRKGALYPSDHDPLTACLQWRDAAQGGSHE